jgi:large subunit ribosomal protein L18
VCGAPAGATRPRLAIYKTTWACSIIDDARPNVYPASSQEAALRERTLTVATATEVGKLVAVRAKEAGVSSVVFDRGGFRYHGRVKALADAAREGGLEF